MDRSYNASLGSAVIFRICKFKSAFYHTYNVTVKIFYLIDDGVHVIACIKLQ